MLGVTLGSLYVDTQVYVPALLKNLCGMSCSGAWKWISSLWSAMECSVMSFVMGLCVRCDFRQPVC